MSLEVNSRELGLKLPLDSLPLTDRKLPEFDDGTSTSLCLLISGSDLLNFLFVSMPFIGA